jgi:Domain of unknown function (DUF4404)
MMAPMLDETIAQLQAELDGADVGPEKKAELLRLLSSLRAEVGQLAQTDADQAKSIAAFAHLSAHEATRTRPRRELLELSLTGLRKSVREFEQTHPRLVEAVGSLATSLSNLGV